MSDTAFCVHLIDDDAQIRKAISRVLNLAGYDVKSYSDAESFLEGYDPGTSCCAIVDLSLPGKDGFSIQSAMEASGHPVMFLTGHGTVTASVRAMKAGALDFLEKPVDADVLLAAVQRAEQLERDRLEDDRHKTQFSSNLARLTPREREVLENVVRGRLNKQIAGDMGIAEKTVKVHRHRVMTKMGARTVADLVRMVVSRQDA